METTEKTEAAEKTIDDLSDEFLNGFTVGCSLILIIRMGVDSPKMMLAETMAAVMQHLRTGDDADIFPVSEFREMVKQFSKFKEKLGDDLNARIVSGEKVSREEIKARLEGQL